MAALASQDVNEVVKPKDSEEKNPPTEKKSPSTVTVGLLQMIACGNDQLANRDKGERFCRKAAASGADIAVFPEMWNIGYTWVKKKDKDHDNVKEWQSQAISEDSEFVQHFQELAKELNMAIVITYLEKAKFQPRNSATLIDRTGRIVMTYSKIHTCDFAAMEASTDPGEDFYVTSLDTAAGSINVGMMICYDREQPESARILMLKGAELILHSNASALSDISIDQFKVRAYENQVAVAMANYAAEYDKEENKKRRGRSCAFGEKGQTTVIADREEGVYIAKFDIEDIRERQKNYVLGNAFRRPHRYHAIISNEVSEIYKRQNAFGEPFDRRKR
jgi:predicted amidohydrolase